MILEIGSSILRESVGGEIDGGDDESAIPSRRLGVGICGRSRVWHVSPRTTAVVSREQDRRPQNRRGLL